MKRGFSLLELLIVTAIVVVASIVIVGGFAAGIRVWERARDAAGARTSIRLATSMVRKDLSNLTLCRATPFMGSASWIEIPSVIDQGNSNFWPGVIRYEVGQGCMKRITRVLSEAGNITVANEMLLSGIDEISFLYGDAGEDGMGAVVWGRQWEGEGRTNLPVAVKIGVGFQEGGKPCAIQQTLILPRRNLVKDERSRK
jgi:prepilin-type N-terminal cleavage/methylation domain-containing protein